INIHRVNRNIPVRAIFELPEGFDQLGQTQLKDLCIRLEAGIKEIKKEREEDAKSLIAIKQSLGDCEKLLNKTKYELLKTSYNEKDQLLKEAEKSIDKFREDLNTLNSKAENLEKEKESTQDDENKKLSNEIKNLQNVIDEKDFEITTSKNEKEEVEKLLKQSEEECSYLKESLKKVKKQQEEDLKRQKDCQKEFNTKGSEFILLEIKYNHLNLGLERLKVSRNELLDKKQDAEFELQLE
ncbi:unnamed protein product, partial [Brachionus calyciflorus]